ncbi:MAG: GNAT family N-acetyltransferase [Erysipelotrichaceae bacterium]|nr:GNAT family N-acetyltransferase [Erysipelotrichaceae bacterium]
MIKEIETNEIKTLRPLMEYLALHHNEVSSNFKNSYPRHSDEDRIKRFEKEISDGTSKAFGCYENNQLVGAVKIDFDGINGVVDYFVVLKQYQGKGYGKELMDRAIESFKERNIKNIELHVVYGNDAVNFYEKYGFKKQSYIMELKLID